MAEPTAIVLAAGEGTRMASERPKVLHSVAGRSLLGHALAAVAESGIGRIAVVVGPGRPDVEAEVRRHAPDAELFVQQNGRGTAAAVLAARPAIERGGDLLVVFADTPLLKGETLRALADALRKGAVALLAFRPTDPRGYGRVILEGGRPVAVREEREFAAGEAMPELCNAGSMAIAGAHALSILGRIGNRNTKSEFYLTDAVAIARKMNLPVVLCEATEEEVMGVNDRNQLSAAEAVLQARLRQAAQQAGATLVAPDTVFLSADTRLAPDVVVEPFVVFGPGVAVDKGAVIRSFSHIEGAHIGAGATIGPFARIRPGTKIGPQARIGNFVELKAAEIGRNAKANHLTYLGDSRVGDGANVGAGTITCNYDGFAKHRTEIGKAAFIGSNTALVAPVSIGDGAYVAAGSVITENVPADSLAIARGRQATKQGRAKALRARAGKQAEDD